MDTGVPWGGVKDFYRFLNLGSGEVVDEPGCRYIYSNEGYRMLGHIIQSVSGLTFDQYVTEKILIPLKMERTTLSKERFEIESDKMTPYLRKNGELESTVYPYPNVVDNPDFSFVVASGGIISSVRELTNYLLTYMEGGKFNDAVILNRKYIEEMQKIHIEKPPGYYGRQGYGYGWNITEDFFGYKMVSHGGSIIVSTSYLAFIPKLKVGVSVASNCQGLQLSTISEGVLASLMGKNANSVIPALNIERRMEKITGEYEVYQKLSKAKVLKKDGMLYIKIKDPISETCLPLVPVDYDLKSYKFYIYSLGNRQPVEFVVQSQKIDLLIGSSCYHKVMIND
jgi:CubicO group peptidase (beta-lactamase class C family)